MFSPEHFLIGLVIGAILLVTIHSAFHPKESDSRSLKRLKRKVRKYSTLTMGLAFAFAGSLTVGHMIGTLGSTENSHSVTEAGISPIYIICGFLAVLMILGIVVMSVAKFVQSSQSRSAHV
ncbi:MAG: hypothetical protein U0798_20975 [Gemmataceae bacterium]